MMTPPMSTGVFACSSVRTARTCGPGRVQNGLLSLLTSARNERTCGSILGSVAASGAAMAAWLMAIMAPAISVALVRRFMALLL